MHRGVGRSEGRGEGGKARTDVFAHDKPRPIMPHAVLQRVHDFPVREAQQLGARIDDGDVCAGQNINHGGVLYPDDPSADHDEGARDTVNPTPEQLFGR